MTRAPSGQIEASEGATGTARGPRRSSRGAARMGELGARAFWTVSMAVVGAWLLGVIANDRWLWSQYLWWVPGVVAGASSLGVCAVGWALWGWAWRRTTRRARREGVTRPGRWWSRQGAIALAGCVLPMGWFVFADVGWLGTAPSRDRAAAPDRRMLRVGYLNAMGATEIEPIEWMASWSPDVAMLANTRRIPIPRAEAAVAGTALAGGEVLRWRRFYVLSRWAIEERGMTSLGLRGRVHSSDPDHKNSIDNGLAAYIVVRPSSEERVVIWMVDLPSDVFWPRAQMTRVARARIDAYRRADGSRGFPDPDVIVGDFNISRGSRSLGTLLGPGMRSSFAAGGSGYGATWPRPLTLWHLDQVYVDADAWRVRAHALPDPGAGYHRAVVTDLQRR